MANLVIAQLFGSLCKFMKIPVSDSVVLAASAIDVGQSSGSCARPRPVAIDQNAEDEA
jgi:hypothetical protein